MHGKPEEGLITKQNVVGTRARSPREGVVPLCNVTQLETYPSELFGCISNGNKYSGFGATVYSDMMLSRSNDKEVQQSFINIVKTMNEQYDMVDVAYSLLEKVRLQLNTEKGTASNLDFPINMPIKLKGKDVKVRLPGWNLTSRVTASDGTPVVFGHNPPRRVGDAQMKNLHKQIGNLKITELYAAGGSFFLLACGFTQEQTVRGGTNPYYLGPVVLRKFGVIN
tara:strand:+ start:1146 stop:1817 length:672 start_codon:yes stop_codon:yes gene_type:complete